MARGRGRGRGRGRKTTILAVGSSVGARVEANEENQPEQTPNVEVRYEAGHSVISKNTRNLSLNYSQEKEDDLNNSDLDQSEDGSKMEGNETVTGSKGEQVDEKKKEPWVNMFKNNRVANNGMNLTYFPPQIVNGQTMVQLESDEVQIEEDKWKYALIAYVIGECPGFNTMHRYGMMNWAKGEKPEVFLHDEGYYIIKFKSLTDMNEVLYSGPYTISNRPIILKQWSAEFEFGKEFLTEIPLWVNFPKLPLNCWGAGSLSRIASAIGVPLFADECTTKQTRISYARMLIEVNVTKPVPEKIVVKDPNGRTFMQDVVMEWKPVYCEKCQRIGHQCQDTTLEDQPKKRRPWKKVTQAWQYKGPIQQQGKVVEQRKDVEIKEGESHSAQEEENMLRNDQVIQTPEISLRPHNGNTQLEFSLSNFPMLSAIPIRNGFESLMNSKLVTLPVDRGGTSKSC
ncbi:uncharacterized protein LOC107016532 [Solanum pennellii]|uniref:Uncharacterized protein LOC107016532 n=1 Tax=Solanum pennellii TaxID=28526 RepID=A0ABM1GKS1_SOLPN|nr:uncharacterized protein LOC107016532 [Solanum pennellii]